jgi:hypothetical protein
MKPIDVYKQFHVQHIRGLQEQLQSEAEAAEEAARKAELKFKRSIASKAGIKIPASAEEAGKYSIDFTVRHDTAKVHVSIEADTEHLPECAAHTKARMLRRKICDLASTAGAARFATWANMRNGGETPNPKTLPALLLEWVEFNACSC